MDMVLITLGVLGMGAIVISAYVFTVAARNYVSHDIRTPHNSPVAREQGDFIIRNSPDRRKGTPVQFPITVNSVVITHDRRELGERRAVA